MSKKQRIIHAISFEVGALVLLVTTLSPLFGYTMMELGIMGAVFSLLTVTLLYFYNHLFDKTLLRRTGSEVKSGKARVIHALLFEALLFVIFLPLIIWWLDIGVIEALTIEAAAIVFMVVYTYLFHWLVENYIYKRTKQH